MDAQRRTLVAWLRDAHAMDRAAVDNLRQQVRRTADHPELCERLQQQLAQHDRHREKVEDCLARLGASPSTIKDTATRAAGLAEAWAVRLSPDDVVKNLLATQAYAWFGVGSYTALAEAAQACGESEVAGTCRAILEERRAAADWLLGQLPETTRGYMRDPVEAQRRSEGPRLVPPIVRSNPLPAAIAAAAGIGLVALAVRAQRRNRITDFEHLYYAELQELLSAEAQIEELLGRAARAAEHRELETLLADHARGCGRRRATLEQLLRRHGRRPHVHRDQSMTAMARETRKMIGLAGKPAELGDAGLIASLQRLAHYQIAAFGTAASWAGDLGFAHDRQWLHGAAQAKRELDEQLTAFARSTANPDAQDATAAAR